MHWCEKALPFIAVVIRDTETCVSTPSAPKPLDILSIISSISCCTQERGCNTRPTLLLVSKQQRGMVEEPQRGGQEAGEGTGVGDKKAGIRGEVNRRSVILCGSPGTSLPCLGWVPL